MESKKIKVLMVCLGNICRSPLAEGILRHKAEVNGVDLDIDSCGTSNYHIGQSPDKRSAENALTHGVDIRSLRARQFKYEDFDEFDYIFTMDEDNYNDVLSQSNHEYQREKVDLLLNLSHPGKNLPVPDPYYGGPNGFEDVYQLVDSACEAFIRKLK